MTKHKRFLACVLLLSSLAISGLMAQRSINASGGNAVGSGGAISFTIGQVNYQSYTGSNGTIVEGIQNHYTISLATVAEQMKSFQLTANVYPNPTTDIITLKVGKENITGLRYQLFDAQGKSLINKSIVSFQTEIAMQSYTPQVYFLRISQNNQEIKTFKIIKH